MSWDAAREYYYMHKASWSANRQKDNRPTVCFTGFTASERDTLVAVAATKNLKVVKSVTVGLHFLVCGPNAGPKKVTTATSQGVATISEDDFRAM